MGILNKLSISEVINAIKTQNKNLICSVPGIGQKMSDRLILELKIKLKNVIQIEIQFEDKKDKDKFEIKDPETNKIIEDLKLTLQSLNYKNKEIKTILPIIINEVNLLAKKENNLSFENLLKLAMNYLDKDSSNLAG